MKLLRWVVLVLVLGVLYLTPGQMRTYGLYITTLWVVYWIAGMGLNLTVGYAGQISLGQGAFLGIGAYVAAILGKAGVSYLAIFPAAALVCFAIGLLLGFPQNVCDELTNTPPLASLTPCVARLGT